MMELEWEEPRRHGNSKVDYMLIRRELMANPHRWAVMRRSVNPGFANAYKRGLGDGFEVVTRTEDGDSNKRTLYARYVGGVTL